MKRRRLHEGSARVYVIEAVGTGMVKIGWTSGPVGERLADLQAASPHELRVLATVSGGLEREAKLHRLFAEYRVRGEWFEYRGRLADCVERRRAEVDKQMSAAGL